MQSWVSELIAGDFSGRHNWAMPDVTRILLQIEQGDPVAAEQLLPLVYDELRKLAAEAGLPRPGSCRAIQPTSGSQS